MERDLLKLRAGPHHGYSPNHLSDCLGSEGTPGNSRSVPNPRKVSTPPTLFNFAPYELRALEALLPKPCLKVRLSRFGQLLMKSGYERQTTISRILGNLAHLRLSPLVTGLLCVTSSSSNTLRLGNRIRASTNFVIRSFGALLKDKSTDSTLKS